MKAKMKAVAMAVGLVAFAGSAEEMRLVNPERGFRYEIRVGNEQGERVSKVQDVWPFDDATIDDGATIAQAYCYLNRYCDAPISEAKLQALQRDFDRARKRGVKYLLRFAYEGNPGEPAPLLPRVEEHIRQLTPIVRQNADVIYVLQIGWIGLWGEFHSNPHGYHLDEKVMAKMVEDTLAMLPENRSTMMRRHEYRAKAAKVLGWDEKKMRRVGFFNDGTLANFSDGGTFPKYPYSSKGCEEFDTVTRESAWYPVDGELFWNTDQGWDAVEATGIAAIKRLQLHHYSTFSIVHGNKQLDMKPRPGTIDAWKITPVSAELLKLSGIEVDERYFKARAQVTAYEYIRDHLGYRLGVTEAKGEWSQDRRVYRGKAKVLNCGFARPVNPRRVWLVSVAADGTMREFDTGVDARDFAPGQEVEIPLEAKFDEKMPAGCELALWLPDEAPSLKEREEYSIAIAYGTELRRVKGRRLNVVKSEE